MLMNICYILKAVNSSALLVDILDLVMIIFFFVSMLIALNFHWIVSISTLC